jgi:pantetheine-phosphate adenylyltransferase
MTPRPSRTSRNSATAATSAPTKRPATPPTVTSRRRQGAAPPTAAAITKVAIAKAAAAAEAEAALRSDKLAVYPGTFDPITNGHLDILERALRLFEKVIVTLAVNPRKQPLFTVEERVDFIKGALPDHVDRLEFASFDGLLVDFVRSRGATTIVRGLRALADFEYEFQFAHMNRRLAPSVDTMFFMTDERNHYVSSSLVKEVASLGGDVAGLVPPPVEHALATKYRKFP